MLFPLNKFLILVIVVATARACSSTGEAENNATRSGNQMSATSSEAKPAATPSRGFTSADIAKLKWIEGSWRGMDGDKPFYERYTVEEKAMLVEALKEDGSSDGEPGRFELKNGEFGKGEGDKRSVASEITESYIQFVPAVKGQRNSFRFERQADGTWIALLEWPATAEKLAGKKIYKMEPWLPGK
jgi:hypothetical protein